jgi:hypothetical protein
MKAGFGPPYEVLKSQLIGDKSIVKFVKDLRNHNNHINILEAAPHYTITKRLGTETVTSGLRFNRATILAGKGWSPESMSLVSNSADLQVVELINSHFKLASEFYRKALTRIGVTGDRQFRDLEKLRVARRSLSYRHALAIILQVAIPKKLDPYEYLHRWFTPNEIGRIRALPDHSKAQVDYLISLRDPLGLCDTDTREKLCELFSASDP